ncbi:MAG TPA: hypothetical protein VFO65_07900, partial [Acidimicrobiales bacterium]|nr:hypothetical protein [Acidimicrobiales bacterium]
MPDDAVIDALADEYWHFVRATAQLWNVDRGDVGQIEHWEDLSPAGLAERAGRLAGFARRAEELGSGGFVDPGSDHDVLVAAVGFNAGATAAALPYDRDLALVAGPFNVAVYLSV